MEEFGSQIAELRKSMQMSQAELAMAAGVSQATISRLESSAATPSDIRLLAKLAKALKQPLTDFLPQNAVFVPDQVFYAFCPNPICNKNTLDRTGPLRRLVLWTSWRPYPSEDFENINFCGACGKELVKECPECRLRFVEEASEYCTRCGHKINNQPTQEQLNQLVDDDIPF
jgi:transcriptional regulator with XRE-family HTH domain